jgi:calcineurin-like phosphoesterase
VIGVEAELAIQRMRTGIPVRFKPAKGGVRLEGVVVDCDPVTGKATAIEALRIELG